MTHRASFLLIILVLITLTRGLLIDLGAVLLNKASVGSISSPPPAAQTSSASSLITFWGPYIDSDATSNSDWAIYVDIFNQLKTMGFTHTGLFRWSPNSNIGNRLTDLRNSGHKIALIQTFDTDNNNTRQILLNTEILDPQTHSTNGQNFKYFDTPGFDPYTCPGIGGEGEVCSPELPPEERWPRSDSLDPAYTGPVWQQELNFQSLMQDSMGLNSGDAVLFDIEIWGRPPGVEWYYPSVITNSAMRYFGSQAQRFDQYKQNWKNRGLDLVNTVKDDNPNALTLFYAENLSNLENDSQWGESWMPTGTGDARSPELYLLPNLIKLQDYLAAGNYSTAYPWISFSYYGGGEGEGETRQWDPIITQRAGFMLRQEGVEGIIVYPGPPKYGQPAQDYLVHAQAFIDGFVNGINPPNLQEVCGDRIDNDGDAYADENCQNYFCENCGEDAGLCLRSLCEIRPQGCYFVDTRFPGFDGECLACENASSCSAYEDDQTSCLADRCGLGSCIWNQNQNQCATVACGDGIVSSGEQCDDGNNLSGDGCSATCQIVPQGSSTPPSGGPAPGYLIPPNNPPLPSRQLLNPQDLTM